MLSSFHLFTSFSVNDIDAAKKFYVDTLGFKIKDEFGPHIVSFQNDAGTQFVAYQKDNHEPASYTVLNVVVQEIENVIQQMSDAGVTFEQYDGTNGPQTDENGVATQGERKMAWFKDPAGNVHGLHQG